nr:MAG TPA: hypothetical protein [Caudoviricetes sp.]
MNVKAHVWAQRSVGRGWLRYHVGADFLKKSTRKPFK